MSANGVTKVAMGYLHCVLADDHEFDGAVYCAQHHVLTVDENICPRAIEAAEGIVSAVLDDVDVSDSLRSTLLSVSEENPSGGITIKTAEDARLLSVKIAETVRGLLRR